MYSLVFGDEGVAKVTGIIRAELEQNLRLVGATKLSDLSPSVVNTSRLDALTYIGEYVSPIKTSRAKL
jgi:isopentenyl diphosphate isomerase/L-lactate dehydrogenase-like FMN-dependent dehydrogenase